MDDEISRDERDHPATHTEGETLDLSEGVQGFGPGHVFGERG